MTELPKLPEAQVLWIDEYTEVWGHTDETLSAYGAECRRQALEEAAMVCDAEASIEGIAQRCAAAIRGMK